MKKPEIKDRVYVLKDGSPPLSFMLPSRNTKRFPLLHFDEETNTNRALRYARNQKSPFEDEQDGNYILEPIVFEDGALVVQKNNPVLQKFLDLHPAKGDIFEEFDPEKEAAENLEYLNFELDAQIAAREISIDTAMAVLRVMIGSRVENMTSQEIRRDIMVYAKNNPEEFLEMIDDSDLQLRNKAAKYIEMGYLQFRNAQRDIFFNLKDNKRKMMSVPLGEEPINAMAAYFKTQEGIEVEESLNRISQE
jgi:hypothetical protein